MVAVASVAKGGGVCFFFFWGGGIGKDGHSGVFFSTFLYCSMLFFTFVCDLTCLMIFNLAFFKESLSSLKMTISWAAGEALDGEVHLVHLVLANLR